MKSGIDEILWHWVRDICERVYCLGRLKSVVPLDGGFTNTSYKIIAERQGVPHRYVLRCYEAGRKVEEIDFEHSLLTALRRRGFSCVPTPLLGSDGMSHYRVSVPEPWADDDKIHISVFTYLPGESKYSWDSPFCDDSELVAAAALLARFHNAIYGWPGETGCCRGRVADLLPHVAQTWQDHAGQQHDFQFRIVFQDHLDYLLSVLNRCRDRLSCRDLAGMPELAIHGDYHPGNLKFKEAMICGLLDFDWARLDLRAFDLALALVNFCAYWQEGQDGQLDERRVRLFVRSYQGAAGESPGVGPMTDVELTHLSSLVLLAALFTVHWVFDYARCRRRGSLLPYLLHGIRMVRWLDQHRRIVDRWITTGSDESAANLPSGASMNW